MKYYGKVYRPPSEANSLIIQCTIGCAFNTCTFCSMYKEDSFTVRKKDDIIADLEECVQYVPEIEKIFLADGDAMVLPTETLIDIITKSYDLYPKLKSVNIYATVKDILKKSEKDLSDLKNAGLVMVYIGLESGSDKIIKKVKKNQTQEEFVLAVKKLKKIGIKSSVTLIFGLGEYEDSEEHILESAKAVSLSKPDFVSFLSLYLEPGAPLYDAEREGKFTMIDDMKILEEMEMFIKSVDSEGTIFRSNHASNPVAVKGTFNRDRNDMLNQISYAKSKSLFRPKSYRAL